MATLNCFSTSADGVISSSNFVWATARAGSLMNVSLDDATKICGAYKQGGLNYYIHRSFFYFDTSSLPADATINSVTINIYMQANGNNARWLMTEGTQADVLTIADWSSFGDVYGDSGSDEGATEGYKTITLNATAIANINKSGITKMCLFDYTHDYWGAAPADDSKSLYLTFVENGESTRPYLEVDYSVPSGDLTVDVDPATPTGTGTPRTSGRWSWTPTGESNWSDWFAHGVTESIPVGNIDIRFLDTLSEWTEPSNITNLAITDGGTFSETGTYISIPSVVITTPSTDPYDNGENTTVDISGTGDGVGGTISSVTWENTTTGGSGSCSTSDAYANWSVTAIPVNAGSNNITITITNTDGGTATDTIVINRGTLAGWTKDETSGVITCGGQLGVSINQNNSNITGTLELNKDYLVYVNCSSYSYGTIHISGICTSKEIELDGVGKKSIPIVCNDISGNFRITSDPSNGFSGELTEISLIGVVI